MSYNYYDGYRDGRRDSYYSHPVLDAYGWYCVGWTLALVFSVIFSLSWKFIKFYYSYYIKYPFQATYEGLKFSLTKGVRFISKKEIEFAMKQTQQDIIRQNKTKITNIKMADKI